MKLILIDCGGAATAALARQLAKQCAPGQARVVPLTQLEQPEPDAALIFLTPPYQTPGCWQLLRRLDTLPLAGRLCSCLGPCEPVCGGAAQAVRRVTARLLRRGALVCLPGLCCGGQAVRPGVDGCGGEEEAELSVPSYLAALAGQARPCCPL